MNEDRKKEPGERMNDILSADMDDGTVPSRPQSIVGSPSPLDKLPHTRQSTSQMPLAATQMVAPQTVSMPHYTPEPASPQNKILAFTQRWGPPFWTITGILSLTVNVILMAVLLAALQMMGPLQGTAGNLGTSVLGGLYSNFEKMDRATIRTTIPVEAQIPLNISVPVQTTTQITLAETVDIPNAQVQINTGGVAINSNARVTLPAGTPLIVNLNFDLPVQTNIPVHLEVPVNIPMKDTELHEPFVGLQEVVRPLYCLVDSGATNLDGQVLCQ